MVRLLLIVFLLASLLPRSSAGQSPNEWSFEQLDSLQQVEPRPVVVFIHTDWCRYCRAMEQTAFPDQVVTNWLDSAFYFVALNAEGKQDIRIRDQAFRYRATGHNTGQHELAEALGTVDGQLVFPTLCFLTADYQILYQQAGYVQASALADILKAVLSTKKQDSSGSGTPGSR